VTAPGRAATIGANIRAARLRAGWTQARLGAVLGVGKHAVSKWELGRITVRGDGLECVAAALGVPVDRLLGGNAGEPR